MVGVSPVNHRQQQFAQVSRVKSFPSATHMCKLKALTKNIVFLTYHQAENQPSYFYSTETSHLRQFCLPQLEGVGPPEISIGDRRTF